MKPFKFEIDCWFTNGKFYVNIDRDLKGNISVNPSTSKGHGEGGGVRLKPEDIDAFNTFVRDSITSFENIVNVNQALLGPEPKKEEKDETTKTGE